MNDDDKDYQYYVDLSNKLEEGLLQRGFNGIENIDSMGCCHKDEQHFVLRTDGLIIYSNIPFWNDSDYYTNSVVESWDFEEEFSFEKLDKAMIRGEK